jgi:hypothetical protein
VSTAFPVEKMAQQGAPQETDAIQKLSMGNSVNRFDAAKVA